MFKLELTDGHKTISAMEYSTIKILTSKLSPGTKIKVIGPLKVVNHILLLEPKNLEILGGDVEHLLIVNAYENVLLRALNKPTTNTPILDYKEDLLIDDSNQNATHESVGNLQPVNQAPSTVLDDLSGIDFDDDFDMEALMETMAQAEASVGDAKASEQIVDTATPMVIDNIENILPILPTPADDPVEFIEITEENFKPVVRSQRPPSVSSETIVICDDTRSAENYREMLPSISQQYSDEPATKKVARIEPTRMMIITDDYYKFKSHTGENMVTCDQYLVSYPLLNTANFNL